MIWSMTFGNEEIDRIDLDKMRSAMVECNGTFYEASNDPNGITLSIKK